MSDNIYAAVKQVIKNIPPINESAGEPFHLERVLALKADKFDVEKMFDEKANKV